MAKVKGKFCYNRGDAGHRSRECSNPRGKGQEGRRFQVVLQRGLRRSGEQGRIFGEDGIVRVPQAEVAEIWAEFLFDDEPVEEVWLRFTDERVVDKDGRARVER